MKGASKQLLMGLNICRGSLACEQRPQSWAGTNPWGTPSTSLTPPKAPFPRAGGGCGSRTVTHVCKSHKNSAQVTVSLCPCQARLLSLAVMSLQAEGDTQTQHCDPPKGQGCSSALPLLWPSNERVGARKTPDCCVLSKAHPDPRFPWFCSLADGKYLGR